MWFRHLCRMGDTRIPKISYELELEERNEEDENECREKRSCIMLLGIFWIFFPRGHLKNCFMPHAFIRSVFSTNQ